MGNILPGCGEGTERDKRTVEILGEAESCSFGAAHESPSSSKLSLSVERQKWGSGLCRWEKMSCDGEASPGSAEPGAHWAE